MRREEEEVKVGSPVENVMLPGVSYLYRFTSNPISINRRYETLLAAFTVEADTKANSSESIEFHAKPDAFEM